MSESVLNALMQLFAIVADVDGLNDRSRNTVRSFLQEEVGANLVETYLKIYDDYIQQHHFRKAKKDGKVKRTSRNAVKILRIATEINKTLTRQQKLIALIRLIEYIHEQNILSDQNLEFLDAIVESFNIDPEEFKLLRTFVGMSEGLPETDDHFIVFGEVNDLQKRQVYHAGLSSKLVFVNLQHSKVIAFRMIGSQELYLGGNLIKNGKVYLFRSGSSIRSSRITPVYHSDVLSKYTNETLETPVVFAAEELEYHFNKKDIGLHPLSFYASSGQMVGIMGGSGTGKSTLLNVLNGNYVPTKGVVNINGVSLHSRDHESDGLIGYVPQDDLLIEELTVFQNLYYNAQLSFGNLNNSEIEQRVLDILQALGLSETQDLKVGSALEKTISGGQRKRVNIALELIREPAVLFVDEPTSGLSSRDSENIMDLLKELTLKGKLIFVVIHQPSSEIFKMFDKLLILDKGGHLIYQGDPLDGITYFRDASGQVNNEMGDCPSCGNVNPEQIFDVIEAKVVNEYGDLTNNRKRTVHDWVKLYNDKIVEKLNRPEIPKKLPKVDFSIPNALKQFKTFAIRDLLSKVANTQYMVVNLLEAPVLALIIAGFLRFKDDKGIYVFRENENILAYIFISVVVALFLGLSVSAEEIIKDKKMRKRESFLNLSKGSYLASKVLIQFGISAIQIFLFVLIGNAILGIKGMTFSYWIVLFTAACFANITGLNISASFKKVVTIYILIPFIVIPQILFSGVLVKYDELNPWFSSMRGVPVVGDIMASRWAFEALAVNQIKENKYERNYFEINRIIYHFNFVRNYWLPEMEASISAIENALIKGEQEDIINAESQLVYNELMELPEKEIKHFSGDLNKFKDGNVILEDLQPVRQLLSTLNGYYGRMLRKSDAKKDEITFSLKENLGGEDGFLTLRSTYENEQLWEFVNNKNSLKKIVEIEGELFRNENKMYQSPQEGINHYYGFEKEFFGRTYSTFWFNVVVLWITSLLLVIALYFDVLPRLISTLSGNRYDENE